LVNAGATVRIPASRAAERLRAAISSKITLGTRNKITCLTEQDQTLVSE